MSGDDEYDRDPPLTQEEIIKRIVSGDLKTLQLDGSMWTNEISWTTLTSAVSNNVSIKEVHLIHSKENSVLFKALDEILRSSNNKNRFRLSVVGPDWDFAGIDQLMNVVVSNKGNQKVRELVFTFSLVGAKATRVIAKSMCELLCVDTLCLSGCRIGEEGAMSVAEMLRSNKTLTHLSLCCNLLLTSSVCCIAQSLQSGTNDTLQWLNLSENSFQLESLSRSLHSNTGLRELMLNEVFPQPSDTMSLGEALKVNKTLKTLWLNSNRMGSQAAHFVFDALKFNSSLTELHMDFNMLDESCCKDIANALKVNSSLAELRVRNNSFGPKGARLIAEGIKINTSLSQLDLCCVDLESEGAEALAASLKINQNLTSLDMSNNCIAQSGARAVAEMLKCNRGLTKLDLSANDIGPEGGLAIGQALSKNATLKHLALFANSLLKDGGEGISKGLSENHSLEVIHMSHDDTLDLDVLQSNGSLKECNCTSCGVCDRNVSMHENVMWAVAFLLVIRRFRKSLLSHLPKEIVLLIGQALWMTKTDVLSWGNQN